jgi:hypothetical protein
MCAPGRGGRQYSPGAVPPCAHQAGSDGNTPRERCHVRTRRGRPAILPRSGEPAIMGHRTTMGEFMAGSYFFQPGKLLFGIALLNVLALVVFPLAPGQCYIELGKPPLIDKQPGGNNGKALFL